MTEENNQEKLEELEEKLKREEAEKKKAKMAVSGRSVFILKKIKDSKHQPEASAKG